MANRTPVLRFDPDEPHRVEEIIRADGVRQTHPACIPNQALTPAQREALKAHGWVRVPARYDLWYSASMQRAGAVQRALEVKAKLDQAARQKGERMDHERRQRERLEAERLEQQRREQQQREQERAKAIRQRALVHALFAMTELEPHWLLADAMIFGEPAVEAAYEDWRRGYTGYEDVESSISQLQDDIRVETAWEGLAVAFRAAMAFLCAEYGEAKSED